MTNQSARSAAHATARTLALVALLTAPLAVGCVSRTPSDLRGYADLTLVRSDQPGTPILTVADSSPNKFQSQVNDDGDHCELDVHLQLKDLDSSLRINTYPDQVADLISGAAQSLDATTNYARSIVLNASTVYYETPDDTWYSTGGSLLIHALPAPVQRLVIEFQDVELDQVGGDATAILSGTVETTYIGVVFTGDAARACPHLELYPGGLMM